MPIRLALFLFAFLILSCKKEPTSWNTNVSTPIMRSYLGISDLIPDSLLTIDQNSEIAIQINKNIFEFRVDSLIEIGSDTVSKIFSIAPLMQFTFNPGQTFYTSDETVQLTSIETQLSKAVLRHGRLTLKAINTIEGDLSFNLSIPKASKNGEALSISEVIPAAAQTQDGTLTLEIDISDYLLDLTGTDGNNFNELAVQFTLSNPANGNPIIAYNTDKVSLKLIYSELEVAFAEGYMGSQTKDVSESSLFGSLKNFNDAIVNLSSAEAQVSFLNGFGIDVQATIFQFKAWNTNTNASVNLSNNLIGSSINLSRANYTFESIEPYEKIYSLNNYNSNIIELIELLPDSIKISATATLNPFGNISNYNDFISDKSTLSCHLQMRIPLKLSASNLAFKDTLDLTWPGNDNFRVESGSLFLLAKNSFPTNVLLEINALDKENNPILNLNQYLENSEALIKSSTDHTSSTTLLKFSLRPEEIDLLKISEKIALSAKFSTTNYPEEVIFLESDSLKVLISTELNSQLSF